MRYFSRRKFIIHSAGLSLASTSLFSLTPSEVEGPFYPIHAQKDKDFDLTLIKDSHQRASGQVIEIEGKILNQKKQPIEDAQVELWQANSKGRYNHPRDQSQAPIDPHFQGWAVVPSGKQGQFKFKTIYPGTYKASSNWTRPPHIHFKITKQGYETLTTQMYFEGSSLNKIDYLILNKTEKERELMVARKSQGDKNKYLYNIILQKTVN